MKKDIFIDCQIACKFASTKDPHLKELIDWLLKKDHENPADRAFLMLSPMLRKEYDGGNKNCFKEFSILTIIIKMQQDDRINFKKKEEIDEFKREYISKKQWDKLNSKENDKDNIPLVFLSDRKMVLSEDENFVEDLINFPKFGNEVSCSMNCQDFNYK